LLRYCIYLLISQILSSFYAFHDYSLITVQRMKTMKLPFTKMHGIGNDFIVIEHNALDSALDLSSLAKRLCERRFSIGADQLLLVYPSKAADFKMRIFNADGSEVEMCGNGIRCIARYLWDRGMTDKSVISVETMAGVMYPEKAGDLVRVDMGQPGLEPSMIPVNLNHQVVRYPLEVHDQTFLITCVSMGNPHTIIVVDDIETFPVEFYGPLIEHDRLFPKKTNVEFIRIPDSNTIIMRVWERGAGETLACGTGASAVAAAAHLLALTERKVTVQLRGGNLQIEWSSENNHIYKTGPAEEVYEGVVKL